MMAGSKQKSSDNNHHTCLECPQPTGVELDGIIAVHRYNLSIVWSHL